MPDSNDTTTKRPHGLALVALAFLTMLGFAANSLFARLAFTTTQLDPTTFTVIRLVSGAVMLVILAHVVHGRRALKRPNLLHAVLLLAYALTFSFAYRGITAATGALVLFACAQLFMVVGSYLRGERSNPWGAVLALAGLALFLGPSASTPALMPAILMAVAGFAWGAYSLIKPRADVLAQTAENFLAASAIALVALVFLIPQLQWDAMGVAYAVCSGALASGLAYALWYWIRNFLTPMTAGSLQLSVPVITAILGALLLSEKLTLLQCLAAVIVLTGIYFSASSHTKRVNEK